MNDHVDLIDRLRATARQEAAALPANPARLRQVRAGILRARRRRAVAVGGVGVVAAVAVVLGAPGVGVLTTTVRPAPPAAVTPSADSSPSVPPSVLPSVPPSVPTSPVAVRGPSGLVQTGLPPYADGTRLMASSPIVVGAKDAGTVVTQSFAGHASASGALPVPRVACVRRGSMEQDVAVRLSWRKDVPPVTLTCSNLPSRMTVLTVAPNATVRWTVEVGRAAAAGAAPAALAPLPAGLDLSVLVGFYEPVASRADYVYPPQPDGWRTTVTGLAGDPRAGGFTVLLDETVTNAGGDAEFVVEVPATPGADLPLGILVRSDAPGVVVADVNGQPAARWETWDWTPQETSARVTLRVAPRDGSATSTATPAAVPTAGPAAGPTVGPDARPAANPAASPGEGLLVFPPDTRTFVVHVEGSGFLTPAWRVVVFR